MADAPGVGGSTESLETRAQANDAHLVRSVRWRLLAWSGGTTLVVLLALGIALYATVARTLEASSVAVLEGRLEDARRGGLTERGGHPVGPAFGGPYSGTFLMVLDEDGRQLLGRRADPPDGLPDVASLATARERGRDVRLATAGDASVRVLTERFDTRLGALYVQIAGDRTAEQRTLGAIVVILGLGGLVATLVALGVGGVYANRALVPIRESLASQRLALRRQREFAADASHELRTPLTVIRSSVDHLRRHRDKPVGAVGEAVDDIDAEVDHLTSLVDDLLLLARSDSGALTISPRPVDLGEVVAEAAGSLDKAAADKGVRVDLDAQPVVVAGDSGHLRRLVRILVDNAIRHTPSGGAVRVAVQPVDGGGSLVVSDDGPGIRPEHLPHVFDRFWRAPGAPSGGTGLGLAIAASIAHLHGGRITASSRPGAGATFTVSLPGGIRVQGSGSTSAGTARAPASEGRS